LVIQYWSCSYPSLKISAPLPALLWSGTGTGNAEELLELGSLWELCRDVVLARVGQGCQPAWHAAAGTMDGLLLGRPFPLLSEHQNDETAKPKLLTGVSGANQSCTRIHFTHARCSMHPGCKKIQNLCNNSSRSARRSRSPRRFRPSPQRG
jgi:hypothetical protein